MPWIASCRAAKVPRDRRHARYSGQVEPKPPHWSGEYAGWFKDAGIIANYHHRPPYPAAAFDLLASLAVDEPRAVLDVGCGLGDLSRPLAARVGRVDAVDFSRGMIERGRGLPGGDRPNLHWMVGAVEETPLSPPYALITAGDSVHWFRWEIVFPRFARALTRSGSLAIVARDWLRIPALRERLRPIYARFSVNHDYRPSDPVRELERRALFVKKGERTMPAEPWRPTIDEFIGCHHSQNGFDPDRMEAEARRAFHADIRRVLDELIRERALPAHDARLELDVIAGVTWGTPIG